MADVSSRFWSKVAIGAPEDCWEWKAGRFTFGYGQFYVDGKNRTAHRVAWELTHGPVDGDGSYHGSCVCHSCDNPACVNPHHLFLGSAADNNTDRSAKGRSASGAKSPNAKINDDMVRRIRERLSAGITQDSIAREVGISQSAVSLVKLGRTWRSVA